MAAFALTTTLDAEESCPERPVMMTVSYGLGAGGRVGWNWLATQAGPDGDALGAFTVPHFIEQSIKRGGPYDIDGFEPIANWGMEPTVLVVGEDIYFNSLQNVVAFAKASPGNLMTPGAGFFTGHDIVALQMEKAGDLKIANIPTKGGGAPAMKAVVTGDMISGINNLSDVFRAREAGKCETPRSRIWSKTHS